MRVPDLETMIHDEEEILLGVGTSRRFIHDLDTRVDDSIDYVYNAVGNPKFAGNLVMDQKPAGERVFRVDGGGKVKNEG